MKRQLKRVKTYSTFSASADLTPVDLPREGLITEIGIRAALTLSGSTWGGATVRPDGARRCIQNLKIEGDGGRTFLGFSGEQAARLLAFLNLYEFGSSLCTLLDTATESQSFIFHPGSNPKDPFDLTAAIPAKALSTLQAKITCPANTVCDSAQTITGTYYYWINQILDVPVPAGLMTPLGSTLVWPHDANYSDFSKEIDVPAGAFLRRIIMLVQEHTASNRADDEVTAVKLRKPKTGEMVMEARWEDLKADNGARYGVVGASFQVTSTLSGHMNIPDGFVIIDLRKYADPLYGLDLRAYQTGDYKLGLTIENNTGGDDTLIYWDQLLPVESQYVGK